MMRIHTHELSPHTFLEPCPVPAACWVALGRVVTESVLACHAVWQADKPISGESRPSVDQAEVNDLRGET